MLVFDNNKTTTDHKLITRGSIDDLTCNVIFNTDIFLIQAVAANFDNS